jgi:DivIVA domain-containing protein
VPVEQDESTEAQYDCWLGVAVREFTHDDIIAHRFTSGRWKGYDTLEVDVYLKRIADYVGWMQQELARHQAMERTALDLLHKAQCVADETIEAAERDAEKLRRNARVGLENARKDARAVLDAARADADRALLSARVQAEADLECSRIQAEDDLARGRAQIAELEAASADRLDDVERLVNVLNSYIADSAEMIRSTGSRLVDVAEHFEYELSTRKQQIGYDEPIELSDQRVHVS